MEPVRSIVFDSPYLTISHQTDQSYFYALWKGELTEEQVHSGCIEITRCIAHSGIHSVFNDSTHVQGSWLHSVQWVVDVWFPEARQAGLDYFAWVYSKDLIAQIPMDTAMIFGTMKYGPSDLNGVKTFYEKDKAAAWLAAMADKQRQMS